MATDKFSASKAEFTFAGTQYLCLKDYSWSETVQEIVDRCSGESGVSVHRTSDEGPDMVFNFNVLTPGGAAGITLLNALRAGTEGAFGFHPEGDTAALIEFDAANAVINSLSGAGSTGAFTTHAVTIAIDGDLTIRAAS